MPALGVLLCLISLFSVYFLIFFCYLLKILFDYYLNLWLYVSSSYLGLKCDLFIFLDLFLRDICFLWREIFLLFFYYKFYAMKNFFL